MRSSDSYSESGVVVCCWRGFLSELGLRRAARHLLAVSLTIGAAIAFVAARLCYELQIYLVITMNSRSAGRPISRATLIPLILIVFGIFVWGLQYKLSLYKSPTGQSRSIPEAKLLSQDERPVAVRSFAGSRPQLLNTMLPSDFLIAATPELEPGARSQLLCRVASRDRDLRHFSDSTSFFSFRPPPPFALAR